MFGLIRRRNARNGFIVGTSLDEGVCRGSHKGINQIERKSKYFGKQKGIDIHGGGSTHVAHQSKRHHWRQVQHGHDFESLFPGSYYSERKKRGIRNNNKNMSACTSGVPAHGNCNYRFETYQY
jgi:hypothetical protein